MTDSERHRMEERLNEVLADLESMESYYLDRHPNPITQIGQRIRNRLRWQHARIIALEEKLIEVQDRWRGTRSRSND